MSPSSDRIYFPPVEKCLNGKSVVLTWQLVASALSDDAPDRLVSPATAEFLRDPYVYELLQTPTLAFGPKTKESTSEFGNKTAAIHVTPTPDDRYDIKQIKEDALWLSNVATINELAALRIAIIEFQSRPKQHLLGPLSSQDISNVQEAAGANNSHVSGLLAYFNVSPALDAEKIWNDFNTEDARRKRLLSTYLSERRFFTMTADYLMTFLTQKQNGLQGDQAEALRTYVLQNYFGVEAPGGTFEDLVPKYMNLLPSLIDQAQSSPGVELRNALSLALETDWAVTFTSEAIHVMSLIFQILDLASVNTFAPQEVVSQWFKFVSQYYFLDQMAGPPELLVPLKSLVCVISMNLLNISRSIPYITQELTIEPHEEPYLASTETMDLIHDAVTLAADLNLTTAGPVVFTWTLILHRLFVEYQERAERRDLLQNQRAQDGFELERQPTPQGRRNSAGSIISIEKSPYDLFLITRQLDRDVQPIEKMALAVTSSGQIHELLSEMALCMGNHPNAAFRPLLGSRMRMTFLEFLKQSYLLVGYRAEPLSCLLLVVSGGERYWDLSSPDGLQPDQTVAAAALKDDSVFDLYIRQALHRYPYEYVPFVGLLKALRPGQTENEEGQSIKDLIETVSSLTFELPKGWVGYELINEEDNANTFQLLEDIPLFHTSAAWKKIAREEDPFVIPAGTIGRFVSDVGKVALLDFQHSVLALLRKQLEATLFTDSHRSVLKRLEPDEVGEAASLTAVCLKMSTFEAARDGQIGNGGLVLRGDVAPETQRLEEDLVSTFCDTLDSLIQDDLGNSGGVDISVLSACLQVLHAALPILPARVWSYMDRCTLLNNNSNAGRISRIAGNLELISERFELVSSALKLFFSMVESAMNSTVQRRAALTPTNKQKGTEASWLGFPEKVLTQTLLSIAQTTVDIFENSTTWRFESEMHRTALVGDAVKVMNNLVSYTFATGSLDPSKGLASCLAPAANYVVDSFLSASFGNLRSQPLLAALITGLQIPDSTLYLRRSRLGSGSLVEVLGFLRTLLKVADYLDKPSTTIQTQIFKSVALIARLCVLNDTYRLPALSLLGALVDSVGKGDSEPPSLLGYLGPRLSRSFIQIVSILDQPLNRSSEVVGAWKFFSAVMRSRQQWMANCLLTGKTPREALQSSAKVRAVAPDSVLARAIEGIRDINNVPSREALAILEFFTSAQNYWPWIIFTLQEDKTFLGQMRTYVQRLRAPGVTAKSDAGEAANEARTAAYIAETFAMQLYHLRQMGNENSLATEILPDLDYFLRDGVQVSDYNASLHANFAKNFATRYPGCSLDHFKRTILFPRDLGSQYFYAVEVAEQMLSFDYGWKGQKSNGFRHEMETANLNLSLMDAEIALYHAWEYLLLELSICLLPKNKTFARQMLQVAQKCLESNQSSQPPENIFKRLTVSRANLCLTLLQRLAECSLLPKDISQLLSTVWATISGIEDPFGQEQLPYYRILLRILFVVLRGSAHSKNSDAILNPATSGGVVTVTQMVLTILDRVVGRGFRTLVTLVHEGNSPSSPEDVALITAILQACLSINGLDQCQTEVLNIMASHDVLHVATSLFSWADRLADNGDPVYGELALLFLLELSAFPMIAEQLACDGLLGHLTSANLAGHLRRPNVSPFAESAGAARCYGIWAKGVLPLLLNILGALGVTIAPEVAFVLNQFPNLLQSSVDRFEAPGLSRTISSAGNSPQRQYVTLLAVSEIHSLALLVRVLGALRMNNSRGVPEIKWDAGSGSALLENVDFWLSSRKVLHERLLPLGSREIQWRATKASPNSGCENKLEEKVVQGLEAVRDVLAEDLE